MISLAVEAGLASVSCSSTAFQNRGFPRSWDPSCFCGSAIGVAGSACVRMISKNRRWNDIELVLHFNVPKLWCSVPPNTGILVFGRSQIFGQIRILCQILINRPNSKYSAEYHQLNRILNFTNNWLNVQYLPIHLPFGNTDWMFYMNVARTSSNPHKN